MSPKRTALLGAATLQGRELLERLGHDRERLGRLTLAESGAEESVATPVDGEWVVSTPLMEEALEGADLVLCCARLSAEAREIVLRVSREAVVVDLAGSLGGRAFDARGGVRLAGLEPGVHASPKGASLLVAAFARAAAKAGADGALVAFACEPASEMGKPALDELYAQAVALLSFHPLPTEVFGRQAVHDVVSPGPEGAELEERIRREVAALSRTPTAVLVVRPGLFHGVGVAVHARVDPARWREAMAGEPRLRLDLQDGASPAAAVAAESGIVGRVESDGMGGAWAWAAADTLAQGSVGNVVELVAGA